MRKMAVALLVAILGCPALWAASLEGVSLPDEVTVGSSTLHLNGMGLRKKMVFKIYVAGLYLESPTSDAAAAVTAGGVKRIVMHFLSNKATKKRMDEAWVEGFEANSPGDFKTLAERVQKFVGFFGDMKEGDVIECTVIPGTGTLVSFNGSEKGTIDGADFGAALLRIWLGPNPPSEDLKNGMLGAG